MVTKKHVAVETIPWSTWAEKQTQRNDREMAKLMLMLAMGMLHDNATTEIPIACVRKGPVIQALATRTIEAGELVVPLFFKKQSSMVTAGEDVTVHPKAVRTGILDSAFQRIGKRGCHGGWQGGRHLSEPNGGYACAARAEIAHQG